MLPAKHTLQSSMYVRLERDYPYVRMSRTGSDRINGDRINGLFYRSL